MKNENMNVKFPNMIHKFKKKIVISMKYTKI